MDDNNMNIFEAELEAECVEEFPEKNKARKARRRKDAFANKRKADAAKVASGCSSIFFDRKKGRVATCRNKLVRFYKKTAAKKARRTDSANGNAYRRSFDLVWELD